MNINDLRSIVTLVSMLCFGGIVAWAWSRGNRERFEEAKRLPFFDPLDQPDSQRAHHE